MTAIEFVKKHGINNAKTHLSNILSVQIDDYIQDYINDLKQIVEAFNLVDRFGGLEKAKEYVDNFLLPELTRAINLVEQCQ